MAPRKVTLKSGGVRWEVRYNDAGRDSPYRNRRFERKEDAQTFLEEVRRRRRLGELAESAWSRRTVRELALDWWALYVLPNLSPRTRNDYKKLLDRHIIPRLGPHRLRDVTVAVVDDFRAKLLASDVGESQTRQALAVLSGMFTYAEQRERVSKNPVRLVKKPSGRRKRAVICLPPRAVEVAGRCCSRTSAMEMLHSFPSSPTPARAPRRLWALEWRHVRERTLLFEQKNVNGEIVAGQKTGRPARTTPLWGALRDDLLAWQLHSGRRSGPVFPNQRGNPFTETHWGNWSTRIWKPLRDTLGVDEPPYGLRRLAAHTRRRFDPRAGGGARAQPTHDAHDLRTRDS